MLLMSTIVFCGAFTVLMLLMIAFIPGRREPARATAMIARPMRRQAVADVRKVVQFSAIPAINRLLQKMEVAPRLRLLLYQAELKWSVGQLMLMSLAAGIFPAYFTFLRTASWALALGAGILLSFVPLGILLYRRSRRFARFEEELPKALDLITSALRAGHSFNAALNLVAREGSEPVRSEFKLCFDEQNYGLDLRHAMENLLARVPVDDLRIAVTAVLIQKETGGNLAEVLNNTAEVIRERARLKRQVRVHTAHGRMTGWVIGLLPVALLIALYVINPALESLLWKREIGVKLLEGGAVMMLLGGLAIRKIVRMDV